IAGMRRNGARCADSGRSGTPIGPLGSTRRGPSASTPRRRPRTPRRSRSLVKIGEMLEAVESGQIVIDPEGRLLLGDDPAKPSMRAMCLLRAGIHRRHAIVIPVVLEMRGVAGQ